MPLGKSTDNNPQQRKSPVVFSPYTMMNTFSDVDKTKLRPSYWNQMLKIEIIPGTPAGDGKYNWDYKNSMSAYLTHTKAKIMASEIRKFMSDPETYTGSGVLSGETLITISNGKEFDDPGVYLILRKVDKSNGHTLSTYSYEFNMKYYNSIRGYNAETATFDTEYDLYEWLEVEQFIELLESYVTAMTYATAYSVVDATDYRHGIMNDNINLIAAGLGIEVTRSGQNSGTTNKNSKSVFNQRGKEYSGGGLPTPKYNTEHTTIEDIEGDLFD